MKVKNFAGFMKTRLNESDNWEGQDEYSDDHEAGYYGANPEDEEAEDMDAENPEEGEEEEVELTLEDLKAMIDDLTERVKKLEPEEEEEPAEGEEGEEAAEGEESPEGK
jgi:hypothetical protein